MQPTTNNIHPDQNSRLAEYPALASLRLTAGDLKALAEQGFVGAERRGAKTYYKLRFRRGGKQVVRYVGGSDRAEIVNNELASLQATSRAMRDLRASTRTANKMLREAKRALEPVLHANGFVFHGLAIRRPRRQQSNSNC